MDGSTPGFPVLHYLPELGQTHVHRGDDAIQPPLLCHPLILLPSVFSSIRVFSSESALCIRLVKVLKLQLQHQSFQWVFRLDFLQEWLVWSYCRHLFSQSWRLEAQGQDAGRFVFPETRDLSFSCRWLSSLCVPHDLSSVWVHVWVCISSSSTDASHIGLGHILKTSC